jgi:uncharacterized protein (TIGR03118 family)
MSPFTPKKMALACALAALLSSSKALAAVVLVNPATAVTATMDNGTTRNSSSSLSGNTWYEVGVNSGHPTNGLPTGTVTSQSDALSTYDIQPAIGLNALLLDAGHPTGTITFQTPVALHGFSVSGSDGNGAADVTPTLHFTDGTSDTLAALTFQDWFNKTPIIYTTGGRISVDGNADDSAGSNNPRVLANNVTNSVADAGKMIQAISFTWKKDVSNTGTPHTCIFGVSGDVTGTGHYTPIVLTDDSYTEDMIVGVAEVMANVYVQHNLVSDIAGASVTDTNLVNPWGIVTSPSSPFWVSDNGTGLSTVYNSTGGVQSLVVTVPPSPSHPTGIIFNSTTNFTVPVGASNAPTHFIFATEEGTISGWASGGAAVLAVDNSAAKAIYKGLALASIGTPATNYLYAANFHSRAIDVFDANFKPVTASPPLTSKASPFVDTNIPAGFAPFNIQGIGGNLYVTYALVDTNNDLLDLPGPGNGYVDVYDASGNLLKRFAANGPLNSPWGMALGPASFGPFGGALLVGNFGDGRINAFDASLGTFLGPLIGTKGTPLVNIGLWGLIVGNGGKGGDTNTLYFTAGIPGSGSIQDHGLLGSISVQTNQTVGVPWELLQSVNGFQDDFVAATRNANWVASANNNPTPDQYEQVNGVLRVFPSIGDPNHLLYLGAGSSNNVQEVLARIRVVAFQTNNDGPRGGIAVAVTTNAANPSRGLNLEFRDYKSDNHNTGGSENNQSERKFKFLYDGLSWGPQGLSVNGVEMGWTNNVWYWMRLRQDSKADGTNDLFGKVWPSDGETPEPGSWQMVWNYVPSQKLSSGFAGIAGASGNGTPPTANGFAHLEVDYFLLKASGLPSIKPSFGVFGPPLNAPEFTSIVRGTNSATLQWFGGNSLQSSTNVTGPWTTIPIPGNTTYDPYKVTGPTGNKFYRIQQ